MQTFELHIWGPAFGLPSIQAECIAAVAFLRRVLQPEEWVVIPSYDTSSSPSNDFPLLRHGDRWINGLYPIVDHLQELHSIKRIDVNLFPEQRADCSAFSTFISTSAQPLIDLSLYVSSINYRSTTQPVYTTLLPGHLNYVIPPQHRAAARARTQHLGFTGLEVDTVQDTNGTAGNQSGGQGNSHANSTISVQGKGAQGRPGPFSRQTILSMLQTPQHAGRFKLESLVTAFLEPLQEYLGDKTYLLGSDEPTSLDCLAYGYLSLMFYPEVPIDSLRQMMKRKFVKVCGYVERMRDELLGKEKFVGEEIVALGRLDTPRIIAKERTRLGMNLPWQPAAHRKPGLADILAILGRQLASRIPGLHRVTIKHMADEGHEDVHTAGLNPFRRATEFFPVLGLTGGVLAFLGYLAYQHYSGSNRDRQSFYSSRLAKLSDHGEAGAALAVLSQLVDYDTVVDRSRMEMGKSEEPIVEVDVEVGRDRLV